MHVLGVSVILDINDIQENVLTQLKHFIEHHKDLEEGKYVKLLGWEGKDAAKVMISEAIKRYNKSAAIDVLSEHQPLIALFFFKHVTLLCKFSKHMTLLNVMSFFRT